MTKLLNIDSYLIMANRYEPIKVTGRLVEEAIAENEKRGKPHTITELESLCNPDNIIFYFELMNKLGACNTDDINGNYEKSNVTGHTGQVVECWQEWLLEFIIQKNKMKRKSGERFKKT